MRIAGRFGRVFTAATPPGYEPDFAFVEAAVEDARAKGGSIELCTDAREAVRGANAVYTDVWTSMGQDDDRERRLRDLEPYRVDTHSSASPRPTPWRSTACPRTSGRRSPLMSSTVLAASPGSRPRTACTRRRR